MPEIRREDFIVGTQVVKTIQSITWRRRVDKIVKRCVHCNAETATHKGRRFCNECNEYVETYDSKEANAGDIVRMQFIPRFKPTKNWTPAGGFFANARNKAEAEAIKRRHGLIQCLKIGEQVENLDADEARAMIDRGDLKAVPRCFGAYDVETWTAEGETYTIVD